MKQDTQSQNSGKTQRDRVGKEMGEGFRMGEHMCNPWLIHVNVK